MNYEILKAELNGGHPSTGAYSKNDQEAADQLNIKNINRFKPIESATLLAWAAGTTPGEKPRIRKLRVAAETNPLDTLRGIAEAAVLMIERDSTTFDLNLPDRGAMLDALVQGNVLSAGDKDSIELLATEQISRATELGLPVIRPGEVAMARSM